MKIDLLTSSAKKSDITISEATFGKDFNESLVHQAVVSYMAGSRQGSSKQKTRSEVRGGGKKPYRQKGTGRARAGTIRSPIWVGGGRTFAARPRDYTQKVNKKMYKAAMRSIFSELFRKNKLLIVEKFEVKQPKTKEFLKFAKKHELDNALIITKELDENLYLASRNVKNIECSDIHSINPVSLLKYEKVLMSLEALKLVEERIS